MVSTYTLFPISVSTFFTQAVYDENNDNTVHYVCYTMVFWDVKL